MTTSATQTIRHLISLFEGFKVEEALTLFTDDATYRFGNFPTANGKQEILQTATSSHLEAIKGISFKILEVIEVDEYVICEMEITYIRTDETKLILPCTDVFRMRDGLIKDMRIYMDPTPLFAPH